MKIGILYTRSVLERCGGPGTYLYNLLEAYKSFYNGDSEVILIQPQRTKSMFLLYFLLAFNKFLEFILRNIKIDIFFKRIVCRCYDLLFFKINDYKYMSILKNIDEYIIKSNVDILHFHSYDDLYYYKLYHNYNIKVCLTMHSPQKVGDEFVEILQSKFYTKYDFSKIREGIELKVKKSFELSDSYIFPSEQCYLLYKKMGYIDDTKPVRYLITGTFPKKTISQERKNHSVQFMFCGRHNKIKGYDLLIEAVNLLSKDNKCKYKVICTGDVNINIKYPKSDNWEELGWRNDVENIMDYVDVVFVIGRSVYFDLCALEAMSHNCIIIASAIGGNLDLANLSSGVLLFENNNPQGLANRINEVCSMDRITIDKLKKENYAMYKKYASPEVFINGYIKLLTELKFI